MIRSVVTLLNKWYRYTLITPTEIIENRYPHETFRRVQALDQSAKDELIRQQKLRAELATASPIEREFINLREQKATLSAQEYQQRYQELKQKQYAAILQARNL